MTDAKTPDAAKAAGAKTAAKTARPAVAVVVDNIETAVAAPGMKKKDLIDAVLEKVDVKKPQVKEVIEAALAVLGDAIVEGRELNLQPMGRVIPHKSKETPNATVVNCRVRRSKKAAQSSQTPLAADGEEG